MSPAASETSALEASATSTTTEEIEMKKVPPLKIVLPKTKVSGAGVGIGKMHALKKILLTEFREIAQLCSNIFLYTRKIT